MIVKMIFGSHLYGTNTDKSDTDYKGVDLPTARDILLGPIPKHIQHTSTGSSSSKNTEDDVDIEIFSLHTFIDLACQGQTVALDMLHAPAEFLIETSDIWKYITENKYRFYTKNTESFLGYAQKQASKYGIKGSRLNAVKNLIVWLEKQPKNAKLLDLDFIDFPYGEFSELIDKDKLTAHIVICGRVHHLTNKVQYVLDRLNLHYEMYGRRAEKAANNEGIDWKAVSHALRAACQIKELFEYNTITFPRPEKVLLTNVKNGVYEYSSISKVLEDLIDEVKELKNKCNLPESVDREFWNNFIMSTTLDKIIFKSELVLPVIHGSKPITHHQV